MAKKTARQRGQLGRDVKTGADVTRETGEKISLNPEVKVSSRPEGTLPSENVDITNMPVEKRREIQRSNALVGQANLKMGLEAERAKAETTALEAKAKEQGIEEPQPIPEVTTETPKKSLNAGTGAVLSVIDTINTLVGGGKLGDVQSSEQLQQDPLINAGGTAVELGLLAAGSAGISGILGTLGGTTTGTTAGTTAIRGAAPGLRALGTNPRALGTNPRALAMAQGVAKTNLVKKAVAKLGTTKGLLTLGGTAGVLKLQASTAQNILGSSLARADEIVAEVESGDRGYSDAKVELDQILENIRGAENKINIISKADVFGFLGLKDTLVKFEYAKPVINALDDNLLTAAQQGRLNKARTNFAV